MAVKIHTTVALELVGGDESPGVTEGGVLSQETRELNIEALPGDIPDTIEHDVSGMHINETLTVGAITAPSGVTLLDDPESVVASITPPTVEPVDEDIETETALVGDGGEAAAAEGQAEGDTGEAAEQPADSSDES
jgi:large subunit ribosomal protein L25